MGECWAQSTAERGIWALSSVAGYLPVPDLLPGVCPPQRASEAAFLKETVHQFQGPQTSVTSCLLAWAGDLAYPSQTSQAPSRFCGVILPGSRYVDPRPCRA